MTTILADYEVIASDGAGRRTVLAAAAVWSGAGFDNQEQALAPGDSVTFTARTVAFVDLAAPLAVTLTPAGAAQPTVAFDAQGLLCWPGGATITVSNPARFGYTEAIRVRAVLG